MKKMKTLLAAVMALSLCMSLLPMNASAAGLFGCDIRGTRFGHDSKRWCETCRTHDGHDSDKWCAICQKHRTPTACGGYICNVGGYASHIIGGTTCQDDDANGKHDHHCNTCHKEMGWWQVSKRVEPTCTEDGRIEYGCGYGSACTIHSQPQVLTKLGHDCTKLVETITPATCTEPGLGKYQCTHVNNDVPCTHTEEKAIPALGHNWVDGTPVTADCDHAGHSAGKVCSRCTTVKEGTQETYSKTDHDWNNWTSLSATQHQRTCKNYPEKHIETKNHDGASWVWTAWTTCATSEAEDKSDLIFGAGDVAEKRTRTCATCGYSEAEYRKQGAKTVGVRYVVSGSNPEVELATESLTFSLGGSAQSVEQKSFTGFTYASGVQTGLTYATVTDGDTITVYYARNTHDLTIAYRGLPTELAISSTKPVNVPYDSDISVGDIPP